MDKSTTNIGWTHQLNDELQVQKVPHYFLEGTKPFTEALYEVMDATLSNHYSKWKWYAGALHNAQYL